MSEVQETTLHKSSKYTLIIEGQPFSVDKILLSKFKFFKEMMDKNEHQLNLPPKCIPHFHKIIEYMKSGVIKPTREDCIFLFIIAKSLHFDDLYFQLIHFIKTNINQETATPFLHEIMEHHLTDLLDAVVDQLAQYMSYDTLMKLPLHVLSKLLRSDFINMNENGVYHLIQEYIKRNQLKEDEQRELWMTCRFSNLPADTLCEAIDNDIVPISFLKKSLMFRILKLEGRKDILERYFDKLSERERLQMRERIVRSTTMRGRDVSTTYSVSLFEEKKMATIEVFGQPDQVAHPFESDRPSKFSFGDYSFKKVFRSKSFGELSHNP